MIIIVIIATCILVIIFLIAMCVRHQEIKAFNNGRCKCGGIFKSFDVDSQGGIGWKCSICNNYLWTSWVSMKRIEKAERMNATKRREKATFIVNDRGELEEKFYFFLNAMGERVRKSALTRGHGMIDSVDGHLLYFFIGATMSARGHRTNILFNLVQDKQYHREIALTMIRPFREDLK